MLDSSPSTASPPPSSPASGFTVRIGITGHRTLPNPETICAAVQKVLSEIQLWFGAAPYSIELLSSLAEGADRLVSQCILDCAQSPAATRADTEPSTLVDARIFAILPMRPDVYCRTFQGDSPAKVHFSLQPCSPDAPAVKDFYSLLQQSKPPIVAPYPKDVLSSDPVEIYSKAGNRHESYRWAGNYVVDHCDLLLAVWDGNADQALRPGSTASVVEYASTHGRSWVWIHSHTGEVRWFTEGDDLAAQLDKLKKYSLELSSLPKDDGAVQQRYLQLVEFAAQAGLVRDGFDNLREFVLPNLIKARTLATRYQERYYLAGFVGYLCAAAAVATAAMLSLVFSKQYLTGYLLEAFLIAATFTCAELLKHRGWQRKWIDYRYLNERLRATCFLYIAGVPFEPPPQHPDAKFEWLPDGWVTLALRGVWANLDKHKLQDTRFQDSTQVRALGGFLFHAWINHQQLYYFEASRKNEGRNTICERLAFFLLLVTFLIALDYGLTPWIPSPAISGWLKSIEWFSELPHVFAVTFPAVTSALAGIMIFRHFARNAERYSSMSHFLWEIGIRLLTAVGLSGNENQVPDLSSLRLLVQEADRAMAHEHEGWRTVFGVRLPGPG